WNCSCAFRMDEVLKTGLNDHAGGIAGLFRLAETRAYERYASPVAGKSRRRSAFCRGRVYLPVDLVCICPDGHTRPPFGRFRSAPSFDIPHYTYPRRKARDLA